MSSKSTPSKSPAVNIGELQFTLIKSRREFASADSAAKAANAKLQRAKQSMDSIQRQFDEATRAVSMG